MIKKFQFSKLLPVFTGLIFFVCVYYAFHIDYSSVIDTAVYCTALTISGGIFGTTIVWYLKKSQAENTYKIKIGLYQEVNKQEILYNKTMAILKEKYNLTDEDVAELENSSLALMKYDAFQDVNGHVNAVMEDAVQTIEQQNY